MDFLVKDEDDEDVENPLQSSSSGPASGGALPKKSEDKCNGIRFSDICNLFERMGKVQGSAGKLKMLFSKDLKKHLQGQSIFPLLRLILPLNDTERGKYGLKQASIAKTYVAALHLDKNSEDAKRLLNWKDPTKNLGVELSKLVTGDFGLILEDVLKSRVRAEPSSATLQDINKLLDDLANAITVDDKVTIIRNRVLNDFNAIEQKWLVRIIFQDLKIGLKHENVLRAFYPNALKRYNECTNLRTVCEEEGLVSDRSGIQLFINFSPMLAKGFPNASLGQVNTVENTMNKEPFVMDLKLDGERILCHIGDDNSFTLFTRRGNDYTDNYYPVAHNVIMSLRKKDHNFSCILDGEICAFDGVSKNFLPFGQNLSVARTEREYGEDKQNSVDWYKDLPHWMTFVMFDIVYIDGEGCEEVISKALLECGVTSGVQVSPGEISHLPLAVRRRILMSIIEEEQNRVELVPCRYVTSTDAQERKAVIEDYFNEITLAGKEGLVIKNLNSPYEFGEKSRAKGNWVKMKPEYGDHAEDLDLLVLAAYYGEGQNLRGEGLSTFLLGVKDDKDPDHFQTLCKVGTGYNFEELTELRNKIQEICLPWDPKSPPEHLAHWKIAKRDDRPNVYIPPEKSFVMQLKCAEIVDSISFSCGLTCRFPRVQRIRYDKSYRDILSVSDIIAAKNRPRNVLTSSHVDYEEKTERERKRSRKSSSDANHGTASRKRDQAIDDQFRLTNLKKVDQEGRIFQGCTFCVLENDFVYTSSNSMLNTTSSSSSGDVSRRKYTRDQVSNKSNC
jgi:DNA ligase-4